ncbi:MAG: bifunctional (p)ppGpp synthetase/guanosine-3',5'-bis(diphosphate) 3'-pyrophosphohydrolase [Bacteroidales bacterium]|nr:bifunctional (p)ppGpp synthetase/guanosine-3',5'-bis(diphosphate) 3'-pyrophosphohydrolase [Bacteroidales bacterium]
MIEEILKAYLLSLTDKDQIALFATIRTVEANCAEITPYAQEFLKIGAEEINADVVTMSALTAYACLDRTRLSEFIEQKQFGEEVCGILSGILKIPEFNEEKLKTQNENHIKLLVTLSGDVRAIIILLAEHLLKIRHLKDISDPESYKNATEVQYLYSPVAHRIGLYKIKTEMEETCLKFFEYDTYRSIADKLQIKKEERDEYIKAFIEPLKKKFEKSGLKVSIKGRPKSISSIRQKMKKQNIDVDGIYDLFAIRVIIDSEPENEKTDCWKVYSLITEEYKPNPFRLRDWISVPKSSGYESLHTTVIGPEGRWVEVQIRTERMDEVAEKGLAAHWKYKNGTDGQAGGNIFSKIREAIENPDLSHKTSSEKKALYSDEIYIFTPDGDLKKMHKGDTVLDFAFSIHSQVGSKCNGAHVNGKFVSLKQKLQNGDTVKVLTANNQKPAAEWINIANNIRVKNRIRRIIEADNHRLAEIGKEIVRQKIEQADFVFNEVNVGKLSKFLGFERPVDFYQKVGEGGIDLHKIRAALTPEQHSQTVLSDEKKHREAETDGSTDYLIIDNLDTVGYTFAKCCKPLPGDKIFAFVTAGSGMKIHRYDCPNAKNILTRYPYRVVNAIWKKDATKELINAVIKLQGVYDAGMSMTLTNVLTNEFHVHIRSFSLTEEPGGKFSAVFSVNLLGEAQLENLKERFKRVKNVEKVF